MSLASGTKLGPYEILAPLGFGGMGEVYRATDTHLKRPVAIKVLPASVPVAPDGKRFLMLKPSASSAGPTELHVILNWFDDLRRRVPLPN